MKLKKRGKNNVNLRVNAKNLTLEKYQLRSDLFFYLINTNFLVCLNPSVCNE